MRFATVVEAAFLVIATSVSSQSNAATVADIDKEPHHTLVFENEQVRAFHLRLQPNEATKIHRHRSFYVYFPLQPAVVSNEVLGHAPVITRLELGELRTSKGGFNVSERNVSTDQADIVVLEPKKTVGDGFGVPLAIPVHEAAIGELYTGANIRVYSLAMASSGRTEAHTEQYGSLFVALSDSTVRDAIAGENPTDWTMKAGEMRWVQKGTTHAITNTGTAPAALMVFQFN